MTIAEQFLAEYSAEQYKQECRAIAAYSKWAEQYHQRNGWAVIPAGKKPRGIAGTVDNAMRSRVERFQIFTESPQELCAYIGDNEPNGMGIDRQLGRSYPVTVWTGEPIGYATIGSKWRVRSQWGTHMCQIYARINGREYTGRGFGVGCIVRLRETAESKRSRQCASR